MKLHTLTAITALVLTGCGTTSTPVQPAMSPTTAAVPPAKAEYPKDGVFRLQNYTGPEAMDSQEVVQASRECIFSKMRPVVSYLMVKTDQGKVRVPVSVICEPF
jgi:uncharacterized lipoprotein YmbA